ncbi:hypothetical protein fugu_000791 [Takifugu bimaculatus]|uniref:Coiled-coil domain-containing protein 80 n=1 Tax=Takifugu bimaculatus TaxID=433685 RepID=A0A4Z2CHQ7_9TELE|nr:hypothetical protein fugu_000791 [Takifugu bimaculatus]
MQTSILLGLVLTCLLICESEADRENRVKRAQFHQRARLGRLQAGASERERVGRRIRAGAAAGQGSKTAGHLESDQAAPGHGVSGVQQVRRAEGQSVVPGRQLGSLRQANMRQEEGTPTGRVTRIPLGAGAPNLLASFAGKNRILVITAPSESDGYYRLMMSLLKADVYCELAERHVIQIVMFHQEGELGAKVRRITTEGKIVEEPLDSALIPRLMSFLKMEKGKFGMVLLKKTLQVEERYPYPVRLEAMYEAIDQAPMRKLEKRRQKGFVQKCKEAGVEGQVEEATHTVVQQPVRKTTTTAATHAKTTLQTTTTTTLATTTETTTTTRATTTAKPTTTTTRRTTTKQPTTTATTQRPTRSQTPAPQPTAPPNVNQGRREKYPIKTTLAGNDPKDGDNRNPPRVPATRKPPRTKSTRRKIECKKTLTNEHEEKNKPIKPNVSDPEETETVTAATHVKPGRKKDKTNKKIEKVTKKTDNRGGKLGKDAKIGAKKVGKNSFPDPKKEDYPKPTKKPVPPAKDSLPLFLDHFENKRRLLRDEFLESVCDMAIRKISIITIFGSLTNSTMKIDHYQLENDKLMKGIHQEDTLNQDLITELRKEFRMVHDDFYMVLTDTDIKIKQSYEVPIAMKAIFDYIDTFSSRIREMEQQKRDGVLCKKEDKPRSLENFLSRFRWRRRLLIISSPSDEEWSYQQQLYSLNSQACNLGLRHIAILKLVGTEPLHMGGVLELYPINGSTTVEREGLSGILVKDMRNYFQISPEYFSMLLVGKDGNVKSWYPSPMWSMATIYDLVDSMQLRRQEMAIQQSLGMRCPEYDYGYHQHGYEQGYQDGYHQGYGY